MSGRRKQVWINKKQALFFVLRIFGLEDTALLATPCFFLNVSATPIHFLSFVHSLVEYIIIGRARLFEEEG